MATIFRNPAGSNPQQPRRSVLLLTNISIVSLALIGSNLLPILRGEHTELPPRPPSRAIDNLTWADSGLALTVPALGSSVQITGPTYVQGVPQFQVSGTPTTLKPAGPSPFAQDNWPNPERGKRNPQDWVVSYSRGLATFVNIQPTNQEDWPNPRGYVRSNDSITWTEAGNALTAIAPSNPLGAVGAPLSGPTFASTTLYQASYCSSTALLGIVVGKPTNQDDWPNPRGASRSIDWLDTGIPVPLASAAQVPGAIAAPLSGPTFTSTTLYLGSYSSPTVLLNAPVATQVPFKQFDWQNPVRVPVRIDLQKFEDHYSIQDVPALQLWDSPNPLQVRSRETAGFIKGTFPALFPAPAVLRIGINYDWPNPQLRVVQRQDWIFRPNISTLGSIQTKPISQNVWPNPTPLPVRIDLYKFEDHYSILDVPALQRWDNPNPVTVHPRETAGFVNGTFPGFFTAVGPKPSSQNDWPNPKLRVVQRQDWSFRSPLGLLTATNIKPTAQYVWPVPRIDLRLVKQDLITQRNSLTLQDTVPLRPLSGLKMVRRSVAISTTGRPFPLTLATFVNVQPGNKNDWPNPRGPERLNPDWIRGWPLTFATVANVKPTNQNDWPVPKGAARLYPDWIQGWPLNFATTANIKPINQNDWPVPRGPGRVRDGSVQGVVPTYFVVLYPVTSQHEWPNPRAAGRLHYGFTASAYPGSIPPAAVVSPPDPGCTIVGGYFSKGQWRTIIGKPCKPKKRRSYLEPGFSRQQYEDFKEAILAGEVPPSQRTVKRWFEGGAFTRAQYDDLKATIRLERETEAQRQKLATEVQTFADTKAHEDRLAAIEAEAQAARAQNELSAQAHKIEAAARLQALQHHMQISQAMAEFARKAQDEAADDEKAIAMLFEDD